MSLILTRPGCPCPPISIAQLCIDFVFTDATPDQIPLVSNLFLLIRNTLGLFNLIPAFTGFVSFTQTDGTTTNNIPVVVCT